jgi:hypothetical protein
MVNPRPACGQNAIRQTSATTAQQAKETTDFREFEIRVDNKPRGIHSLMIKSDGERHEVEMKSDVRVDVIVYAYVFKFRGKEVWRDGQCILSDIRTEDGGKKRDFFFKTDGKTQQVQFNGQPMPADVTGHMTTAYWMLPAEEHRNKKSFGRIDNQL